MWDDAEALRKLSNILFGASLLLASYATLHFVIQLPMFALRAVQLDNMPQRVKVADIEDAVHHDLRGNFFTVDLERARAAFEKLPWVRQVSVQRLFPWQLEVTLEEQVALARWNGKDLVNVQGEVFDAEKFEQPLPTFNGPDGTAAEVKQNYEQFGNALAPLKQEIAQINLSPRRAWQLRLQNGMVLELGREQMQERLARFVAAYPQSLGAMKSPVKYVDLRYRNGFAVKAAG